LHFRAVGAEMYKKSGQVESFRANVEHYEKGKKTPDKAQSFKRYLEMGEIALRELELSFSETSDDLKNNNFANVSALIIEFEEPPSIMTVGAFAPAWDYDLLALQHIDDFNTSLKDVSLSLLNADGRACAAIIWQNSEGIGHQFATSLLNQPKERLSTMLIKTAFHLIENTCIETGWWNGLKNAQRHVIKTWMLPEDQAASICVFWSKFSRLEVFKSSFHKRLENECRTST
jgi:hypothetical protein